MLQLPSASRDCGGIQVIVGSVGKAHGADDVNFGISL